jgi:lipopolysaccharide export system protein LptC
MTEALPPTVASPKASAQGQPLSVWRRALGLWDKASLYAPLLMMGFLASGTYWLSRNTPKAPAPAATAEAKHDIDYFLRNFTVRSYDAAGVLKSELRGTDGRHYIDTDILEIDKARLHNINPAGEVINATGNRAYSNGDGSEVQLTGDAVVIRESRLETASGDAVKTVPRLEFRGDFLHVFLNEERVNSHKPVVLIRGADQFTGDSFEYNNLDGVANLKGRVKGVLHPRSAVKGTP